MSGRFKTLVRHFFSRFFDKDAVTPGAEAHANVVQIIAMLSVPGAILSLFTIADHPRIRSELATMWLRAGDRYIFVSLAMTIMGFVMTFKWESLFPDRSDYLILTPLPLTVREWFAAKAAALGAFLVSFAVAINIFSCVIVPYAYAVRDNRWGVIPPAFAAHAAAVLSGSIFTALLFAALQGVLINLMTPAQFRRASAWIQMASMAVLVIVLFVTPGVSANMQALVESRSRVLDYIPVFWFLGIYEALNPEGTLIPVAPTWAHTAFAAMAAAGAVFLLTYMISYRRYSRKILEGVETQLFRQPWRRRAMTRILNAALLRRPAERAAFYFIGRIIGRSAKHRLFLAMYAGIGLAVTLSSAIVLRRDPGLALGLSRRGLTEAPLILAFFAVSGLRATFNIPYELGGNWVFQIAGGYNAADFMNATRKWVLFGGVLPVFAAAAPFEVLCLGVGQAAVSLGFAFVVAALLAELFFINFRKVPFTCSYLPAKSHLAFLAGAYLYGFTIYTAMAASLEQWASASIPRMIAFGAAAVVVVVLCERRRGNARGKPAKIMYQDEMDPVVRELHLT